MSNAKMIEDLDIEAYHALGDYRKHGAETVWSKSQLVEMSCPAKFYHKYIGPKTEAEDDADHLNIGNAVHTLALEPDLFDSRFYVLPEGLRRDKRNADYKAEIDKAKGRTMLVAKGNKTASGFNDIKGMAAALVKNKLSMALLDAPGKIEASIFWTDPVTGLKLRARPDFLREDGLIVDLKTAATADPELFPKHAFEFGYDMSVAMTTKAVKTLNGKLPDDYIFLVVETKPPHIIEAYDSFRPWDPDDVSKFSYFDAGNFRFRRAVDRLAECLKTGVWPGYAGGGRPMSVPRYAMKQLEEAA